MFDAGAIPLDDVVGDAVAELTNLAGYPPLDTLVDRSVMEPPVDVHPGTPSGSG